MRVCEFVSKATLRFTIRIHKVHKFVGSPCRCETMGEFYSFQDNCVKFVLKSGGVTTYGTSYKAEGSALFMKIKRLIDEHSVEKIEEGDDAGKYRKIKKMLD